ncbi:hypothetical protein FOZ63_018891 [Perkinsus olseni]|nr:hypothetical protein FOZ63_018891 [Perkinsus olseni]
MLLRAVRPPTIKERTEAAKARKRTQLGLPDDAEVVVDDRIFGGEHLFDRAPTPRVDLDVRIRVTQLDEGEMRRREERAARAQEILAAIKKWRRPLSRPASYADVTTGGKVDESPQRNSLAWDTKIELADKVIIPKAVESETVADTAGTNGEPQAAGATAAVEELAASSEASRRERRPNPEEQAKGQRPDKQSPREDLEKEGRAVEQQQPTVTRRQRLRQERMSIRGPPPGGSRPSPTLSQQVPREKVRLKAPLPGHDEKKEINEVNDHEGMKGMLRYSAATMEVRQYYRRCLECISQRIHNENKLVPSRLRAGLPANGDRDEHDKFVSRLTKKWASADLLRKRHLHLKDWSEL